MEKGKEKTMKYAIVKCINGNFSIDSEGFENKPSAITRFHGVCQTLWNAPDVITAKISIVDEQLNVVDGYTEFVHHETEPEETEATE